MRCPFIVAPPSPVIATPLQAPLLWVLVTALVALVIFSGTRRWSWMHLPAGRTRKVGRALAVGAASCIALGAFLGLAVSIPWSAALSLWYRHEAFAASTAACRHTVDSAYAHALALRDTVSAVANGAYICATLLLGLLIILVRLRGGRTVVAAPR